MTTVHFITGLPRSGSTMLSAILRQNPDISAGITSGVLPSISTFLQIASNGEMAKLVTEDTRKSVANAMFNSFIDEHNTPVVFDTNRGWTSMMDLGLLFRSDAKFIATVRNPAWVMDSLERQVHAHPITRSKLMNRNQTLKARASNVFSSDGLVGKTIENLSSAMFSEYADRLLLLDYDYLCAHPEQALSEIYKFTELKPFKHDFQNLNFKAEKFDELLSTPNLHKVEGPVEIRQRRSILPPHIFASLQSYDTWSGTTNSRATTLFLE